MASQPNHPTYPPQPGQPSYGWAVPVDQGPPPPYNPNPPLNQQPPAKSQILMYMFIISGPPPPYNPNPPLNQQPPAAPANNMYGGADYESGGLGDAAFSFSEKSIRMAFVRKVYAILMVQLAVTVGFISLFVYEPNVKLYSREHPEMWWIAFVMTFVLLIVLACCNDFRRRWPLNIILLGLFTACEGFMLGAVSSVYRSDDVLIAAGICTAVCLALTIFAMQTKWDFTACGGILFVCVIVLFIFGIVAICIPGKVIHLVYASLGALLFSVYLVFDTQLMLGGKHKYSISPEEYIFAALNLYLDIINIFLYILAIVGGSRN